MIKKKVFFGQYTVTIVNTVTTVTTVITVTTITAVTSITKVGRKVGFSYHCRMGQAVLPRGMAVTLLNY